MKKGSFFAASILTAVGAVLFAAAFIASGFDFSKLDTAEYETNTYTPDGAFETIEIRTYEADITFKPSEDGKLRVDCVERKKVRHEVSVENGSLKVTAADRRTWYDRLTLFSLRPQSVTVYLPSGHYAALTITTDTGDVSVPAAFSFGNAEITASTGDAAFSAPVDGFLRIRTSTGDIGIDEARADSIDLSVSTGRIDIKNVSCNKTLSFNVSTGDAVLTDVACRTLLTTGTTGDVSLKNVIASDDLTIERGTGDVRFENCDAGQITVRTSTGDVTGTLLTEKVFVTDSSTGDISVPDTVSGGRCGITTSTGSIAIDIIKP